MRRVDIDILRLMVVDMSIVSLWWYKLVTFNERGYTAFASQCNATYC
jgi:hypothetical protein